MRGTGIATSLMLIAAGAVLAFAVNVRTSQIDVNSIGYILMVVGIIGLALSFIFLGSLASMWSRGTYDDYDYGPDVTPPHEHRRVATRDVVYEDDDADSAYVERERHVRR
ncbi:MAG TPA: hypothetical protein VFY10_09245 [Dehalococcoidia bacterium]|nr:hypothetical protein [Dehalococcoidia bacterium]